MIKRCAWAMGNNVLYHEYHDVEWGVPLHDDQRLFEMLNLEGAQAGLSWSTILNKRAHYRIVFDNFDANKIVNYDDEKRAALLNDPGIVRNRLKIDAVISNALAFLNVQNDFGTYDDYLWRFVDGNPIQNHRASLKEVPPKTELSDTLSKDLKKRGFKFIGSTICYAYMQAVGMVNDHTIDCFRYADLRQGVGK